MGTAMDGAGHSFPENVKKTEDFRDVSGHGQTNKNSSSADSVSAIS
jgi:hypothetical protein